MNFSILHLNVERSKHIETVIKLLKAKRPQVVCFAEAMLNDVKSIASSLKYDYAFTPLLTLRSEAGNDQEGSAILSKFQILKTQKYRYDDKILKEPPVHAEKDFSLKNSERPSDRFLYENTLLTILIQPDGKQPITIATTHFPVVDHTTPGHTDHEIKSLQNVNDLEHVSIYMDRLIEVIRSLAKPIIFTADLNNPRGEHLYDLLAHELVDQVPFSVISSIDPNLYRTKNLELMVDTIMTSPDVSVESFQVIESVSDHKAFFASFKLDNL